MAAGLNGAGKHSCGNCLGDREQTMRADAMAGLEVAGLKSAVKKQAWDQCGDAFVLHAEFQLRFC